MSNLKFDIIYYKTSTDFEMEFNLSGCCRMRMFKDKADTPKGLVNVLARDVSRSHIILVVTDLFSEQSGVSVVSKAIKLPLVKLDKDEFGVSTSAEIMLPQTAVPLITKSGIYGGCIIENGPQSIILVSDDRTLRHEIMKLFVHNYVFDMAQVLAYRTRNTTVNPDTTVEQNIPKETPEVVPAPAEDSVPVCDEVVAEETAIEEVVTDSLDENADSITPAEEVNNFQIEKQEETEALNGEPSFSERVPKEKRKNKSKGTNIALLIIAIIILIGFGVLAYYFVYLPLLGEPCLFTDGQGNIITEFLNGLFYE